MLERQRRPVRGELDQAALGLLARHGGQIMATARRYAATPEDAEDAYQRGLEILLTKAPTTREDELVPWLKTVVKHEAFALRRQRDRHSPVTDDGHLSDRPTAPAVTHDQAERLERLSQGAEALRELKPHEVRALLLKAEGYSYREICELTGWSYTKVNRLLVEGRQAFLRRVASIQGGDECDRLMPQLSALADGEAGAEALALVRPHLKTCLSCRARLREFRAAPARVAAVAPPAALAAGSGDGLRGAAESALAGLQQKLDSFMGMAQQRAASVGERAHVATELATGQKLAAVAASAAAFAGGGTAIDQLAGHAGPPRPEAAAEVRAEPVKEEVAVNAAPAPPTEQPAVAQPAPQPTSAPAPEPAPAPAPPPPPDPATEFAPGGAGAGPGAAMASAPAPVPAALPQAPAEPGGFAPAGSGTGSGGGGGGGSGEFSP